MSIDFKEARDILLSYLRTDTYPLAAKFIEKEEDFPAKARKIGDMLRGIATCQATSIARKWGWSLAVSPKDINCPMGLLGLGWGNLPGLNWKEEILNFLLLAGYMKDREAAEKTLENMPIKEKWESPYKGLVIAPLEKGIIEKPDVILIYGNAAQITRMIQSMVYIQGGVIKSEAQVGLSCASEFLKPMRDKKAIYIVPGRGERQIGMAGNDELVFALPGEQLDDLLTGLKETDKRGTKYPINQMLMFDPIYTKPIMDIREKIVL